MAAVAERLYRSRDDRMLSGVAGGVAETLDADPSLVRVVWAMLTIFTGGIALLVYIVMAIVVPEAPASWSSTAASTSAPGATTPGGATPGSASPGSGTPAGAPGSSWTAERFARREARRAQRGASADSSRAGFVAGSILIVIGVFFLVREVLPLFDWDLWWPIGLIVLGGVFLVFALLPGRSSD
jgi:phage shock protein C